MTRRYSLLVIAVAFGCAIMITPATGFARGSAAPSTAEVCLTRWNAAANAATRAHAPESGASVYLLRRPYALNHWLRVPAGRCIVAFAGPAKGFPNPGWILYLEYRKPSATNFIFDGPWSGGMDATSYFSGVEEDAVRSPDGKLEPAVTSPIPPRSISRSFWTPSGNIYCEETTQGAFCVVESARHGERVGRWDVAGTGRAHIQFIYFGNPADTVGTLKYGQRWTRHGVTCVSRSAALTCTNTSGHGFSLSRGSQDTF